MSVVGTPTLRRDAQALFAQTRNVSSHYVSTSEQQSFIRIINAVLTDDNRVKSILPLAEMDPNAFLKAVRTGVLLCTFLITWVPGSLNPSSIRTSPKNNFDMIENHTALLHALNALGCEIVRSIQPTDLLNPQPHLLLALVSQIIEVGIKRKMHFAISFLHMDRERVNFSSSKTVLIFFNNVLAHYNIDKRIRNFTSDLTDSIAYIYSLHYLSSDNGFLELLDESNLLKRAENLLRKVKAIGFIDFVTPSVYIAGSQKLHQLFSSYLFTVGCEIFSARRKYSPEEIEYSTEDIEFETDEDKGQDGNNNDEIKENNQNIEIKEDMGSTISFNELKQLECKLKEYEKQLKLKEETLNLRKKQVMDKETVSNSTGIDKEINNEVNESKTTIEPTQEIESVPQVETIVEPKPRRRNTLNISIIVTGEDEVKEEKKDIKESIPKISIEKEDNIKNDKNIDPPKFPNPVILESKDNENKKIPALPTLNIPKLEPDKHSPTSQLKNVSFRGDIDTTSPRTKSTRHDSLERANSSDVIHKIRKSKKDRILSPRKMASTLTIESPRKRASTHSGVVSPRPKRKHKKRRKKHRSREINIKDAELKEVCTEFILKEEEELSVNDFIPLVNYVQEQNNQLKKQLNQLKSQIDSLSSKSNGKNPDSYNRNTTYEYAMIKHHSLIDECNRLKSKLKETSEKLQVQEKESMEWERKTNIYKFGMQRLQSQMANLKFQNTPPEPIKKELKTKYRKSFKK